MSTHMPKTKDRGVVQYETKAVSTYTPVDGDPQEFHFSETVVNPRDVMQMSFLSAAEKVKSLYDHPNKEFHELVESSDHNSDTLVHTLYDGSTLETRLVNN